MRSRHLKGPRWRGAVRRVRDWLDGLLEESDEAILASPESAPRESGPPEDWLRRVRQGAPELLRLMEERRIREPHVTQEAASDVEDERSSSPEARGSSEISFSLAAERPVQAGTSATQAQQNQADVSDRAKDNSTSPTDGVRPASGEGRPMAGRVPHADILQLGQTNPPRVRATTPQTHWSERARNSVKAALPAAVTNWFGSKSGAFDENSGSQTSDLEDMFPNPKASYLGLKATRPTTEGDRVESKRPAARVTGQLAPRLAAAPASQQSAIATSDFWRPMAPSPAKIHHSGNATSLDPWPTLTSGHRSERDPSDPWPELPESPPHTTHEWTRFSRNAQRRSALDLEQRGGR